jgi:hypothetical protein
MKTFLLALCSLIVTTGVVAQQKKAAEVVKFTKMKHDFGKIKQNAPVTYDFAFKNVGGKPVVIESATASCGCTTPKWPNKPVVKNSTDKITAGFNAAAPGPFEKTITVKVAGYEQPVELKITGEVLNAEDYAKYQSSKGKEKKTGK